MGIDNIWISLICSCIQTISFSVLVNGEPCGNFTPKRGLHQGDPLSPYLFLLCAGGLHSLIQQTETLGAIKGVSLCNAGPKVSHLFFVDDSLLFCQATSQECTHILETLKQYEETSGQQIKRGKTQLFFSPNTKTYMQEEIKNLLGVAATTNHEKYLGLPSFLGKGKKQSFGYIRERIWHKMQGWKREIIVTRWKRSLDKSGPLSHAHLYHGMFQTPKKSM